MSRKKRRRFAELKTFPNVFNRDEAGPGGAWIRDHFGTVRPLYLELGCGKGEYTLALARRYPDNHVVAVDRKGDRLWKGAKRALEERLGNALFLRADIEDLHFYLDEGQVSEIWIPFPDPLPKRRQAKHRILSTSLLQTYRRILIPQGLVHLKTDDDGLFNLALQTVERIGGQIRLQSLDIYQSSSYEELLWLSTTFQRRHLEKGKTIKYVAFSLDEADSVED